MTMRVERYESASSLQYNAASAIVRFLNEAIAMRGSASLVLSGGSTPKAVYEMIAADPTSVQWRNVRLFWGDERCVPPTHPDSNFRMTRDALLSKIAIPDNNIFRIEAELEPRLAAENYATVMRSEFSLTDGDIPRFDVVMLGLGEDGHTASLFPGTTILDESHKIAAEVFVPKVNAHRISMTFPAINNARNVLFLVSGSGKAGILREILEKEPNKYPAQRIKPTHGSLYWLVDAAAAANLQSTTFHQHSSLLT